MGHIQDMTKEQIKCFETLWFIYGNDGSKCTMLNHKLIQGFYEYSENRIDAYRQAFHNVKERYGSNSPQMDQLVTDECFEVCELVLQNKFTKALEIAKS
ncbi:hypothetical protein KAR91_70670 [Candidatus Pacearchaeota archaeon]|nr:hypothetical protein [Candidatus Pacearchaeota archaeon]